MIFDFSINEDGTLERKEYVWINGKHRLFQGTEYENGNFRVQVTPVTRTLQRKYRKEAQFKTGFDPDHYLSLIWTNHVIGWELNGAGNKPIPFSEGNKKFLLEEMVGFTKAVANCCIDAQVKEEEGKEAEAKNLLISGDGEQ